MIVLGIDAAWTSHHASGVAVVTGSRGAWRCRVAASSYADFFRYAGCDGLLQATEAIAGARPDVIAVDMPLARLPITSRRPCDNMLSSAFGARGCGVHSSTPARPGIVSEALMSELRRAGYELAVAGSSPGSLQILEVYPHAALLCLLKANYRVPYKVGRMRQYWPHAEPSERLQKLRAELRRILVGLRPHLSDLTLRLPPASARPSELKRFEDALDGVICAWIGAQYLEGACRAYGDRNAAIWVPE